MGIELDTLLQKEVNDDEHLTLCQIPTPNEIYQTLKVMNPYKASRLDGYPSIFYIECWDIIGKSMIKAIKSFFISGYTLKEFNYSFIVFIPKKSTSCQFTNYRPIKLCNLIYKLISKF